MKRAGLKRRDRILWLVPTAIVTVALVNLADAQSARFTLIDARNGLTPEVREAYANALGANSEAPFVVSRVKVIMSLRHGAAFDAVDIPEHVRHVDATIDVLTQSGGPLTAPIDVNHLRFARRAPQRISQKTNIRGR